MPHRGAKRISHNNQRKEIRVDTLTDHGRCPDCGKKRWPSRRAANRAAARLPGGQRLSAYRCGDYWHLGHLPRPVTAGKIGRDALVATRQPPRP